MSNSAEQQLNETNEFVALIGDSRSPQHVIRSHRRPTKRIGRRVVTLALVVATSVGSVHAVSTVAEPSHSVEAPVTAIVISEPMLFERTVVHASRAQRQASARQVRVNRAISYAMAQRGDRYRWGAQGPNAFDCSGLVKRAFEKAGVKLPHYTGGILKKGKKVSKRNLQRGDIVFPQRGHVAIYLGGGKMIAASSGKGKVVVQKMYGFYTARRVV